MTDESKLRWSIVIPAYAPGENLTIAIDSVLAAMGERSDFEVVVVDDASPDPIVLPSPHDAVAVERNPHNVGAVPNFNRALKRAQGELIHILHADDYVRPGFYSALDAGFADDQVVAAACCVVRVDGNGQVIETMQAETDRAGIWSNAIDRLAISNRLPAVSVVVRRTAYEQVGNFDETLIHAADWDMWLRIALLGKIYYDPEPLAVYRVHDAQHTASVIRSGQNVTEAVRVIRRLPDRIADPTTRRELTTHALLYRSVYAGRTSRAALFSRDLRTAATQSMAAVRCLAGAARSFLRR